ncbi:MAG: hypothetical protein JO319_11520, partial [Acidobacteriaceae bacterium]|nr:hypothetical protein [Acidobacteriaceae bacterium]
MRNAPGWQAVCWKSAELPRALNALVRAARISNAGVELPPLQDGALREWIEWAAKRLGCEAEPVDASLRNLEHELSAAYPALLHIPAAGYLAVLKANRRRLVVLTPDLKRRAVETAAIARLIRQPFVSGDGRKRETLLRDAGLRGRAFEGCLARMLDDETAHKRWNECWTLQRAPGGPPLPLLRDSGALASGAALVLAHLVQYLLLIASWALLGRFSLAGRTDAVWLAAWALLLFTLLPFQVLGTWLQGMFSIGLGAFLKRRLLYGAL